MRRAALIAFGGISLASLALAATPDKAPPESNAQVENALRALAPAFASIAQRPARGRIEDVILAYSPAKFHRVDEGTLPPAAPGARCPSDMASVGGRFCIDRYEGSLVERVDASDAGGGEPLTRDWPYFQPPAEGHVYVARSVAGVVPQAYVSAQQAEAACEAAHKRLCLPVEWRAACGGSKGYAYPYGGTRAPGKCHDSGAAPMLVFHLEEMKKGWGPIELNDPRLDQLENTIGKTGAYPECVNDYGVYDMVGNVEEWTADPNGTFQGGFWLDTAQHGEGCAYRTIAHGYTYHDYSTGFRCCADVSR